jgi:acyl-CoA thioesterase-1
VDVRRSLIVSLWLILMACPALTAQRQAAARPILVCYGDSITAGHGLQTGQSFPDALQRDLDAHGYHYKVNNQGTSGATTKDAVAGLRSILLLHPAVVIVEFGGNDGLRGLPLEQTRRNLDAVLTALENAHTTGQTTFSNSTSSSAGWQPSTT